MVKQMATNAATHSSLNPAGGDPLVTEQVCHTCTVWTKLGRRLNIVPLFISAGGEGILDRAVHGGGGRSVECVKE